VAEIWSLASKRSPPPRLLARVHVGKVLGAEIDRDQCERSRRLFQLATRIVGPGVFPALDGAVAVIDDLPAGGSTGAAAAGCADAAFDQTAA
jgi:hypothetical protein